MKHGLAKRLNKAAQFGIAGLLVLSALAQAGSYGDFFMAIKRDDAQRIQELLQLGFDPNTPNPEGQLPVLIALREPSLKVANVLVNSAQLRVNFLNPNGESPLMLAALSGELTLAKLLVAKDADINKTGWTPLHYAASKGQLEMINFLLDNYAYIDAASPNGTTPLMMASRYGSTQSVQLLLDKGADTHLKNVQGLTALQFAEDGARPDAIRLLTALQKQSLRVKPAGSW